MFKANVNTVVYKLQLSGILEMYAGSKHSQKENIGVTGIKYPLKVYTVYFGRETQSDFVLSKTC